MEERQPPAVVILSDFDGTISTQDVSQTILDTFARGDWRAVVAEWVARGGGSKQSWNKMLSLVRITEPELRRYVLENFQIDPDFPAFVRHCEAKGWALHIVSDGFDYYIKLLLCRAGLAYLPFTANHIEFTGDRITCEFPFASPTPAECDRCGNCKRSRFQKYKRPDNTVVYIGDGETDFCAARAADLVFAKDELAAYCEREGIAYHPFGGFGEILGRLPAILTETSPVKARASWG